MFKIFTLTLIFISSFIMISCGGDSNNNNNNNNNNRVVWKYKLMNTTDNSKNIPAVDEAGNLYFATNENIDFATKGKFTIVSIDKNGKKRWEKIVENTRGYEKISYKDNKVFFIVGTYLSLEASELEDGKIPFATTYALDASTGNELWKIEEKNWIITWPKFAVSNKKVYVYINDIDILGGATSKLVAYDINNGNSKGEIIISDKSGANDGTIIKNMTVANDRIYALLLVGNNSTRLTQIIDNGDVLSNGWLYDGALDYEINNWLYYPAQEDLPIDDNGNIYFNLYYNKEVTKNAIISISKDGKFNWMHIIETPSNTLFDSVSIDKNGNLYFNIFDKLYSISSLGDSLWNIEKTYFDEAEILDAAYQAHPTIAENGNTYHHNLYGLVSVKNDGTIAWKYQNENTDIQGANYSTILPNGNIIVMGTKNIICFKGDATKLAKTNWPKIYGNNGNTSSK